MICKIYVFCILNSDADYNPSRDDNDDHDMDQNTGFAVVINGHSLVHALHPQLEQLFLDVSSQCKLKIFISITIYIKL